MPNSKTVVFALLAILPALSAASRANAEGSCELYGKLALKQQKDNEDLKCGFSGPAWSRDLAAHIAWCTNVGPDQWKSELKTRERELAACKAK